MSAIATAISILNGLWTLVGNLFGKKSTPADENTQAVEVANKAGKLSADEARTTRAQTDKDLAANDAQTNSDVAAVRADNSLLDNQDTVDSAIARSRPHPSGNS